MNLNCGCVLKYFVLVYSGLCWVMNKICRFKCGNNTKIETAFKKNSILGLGSYQNRSKKRAFGLGCNQNRGQKGIEFKKKKKPIWPRVQRKLRPKGRVYGLGFHWTEVEGASMASVLNRGQKLCSFGLAPICFGSRTGAEY